MTAFDPTVAARIAESQIPMSADYAQDAGRERGVKSFQLPAPHITRADRPAAELVADMQRDAAREQVKQSVKRLRWLLAHPAPGRPATAGDLAEYRHLLHDADPDSTVHPFVDLAKGKPWRTP